MHAHAWMHDLCSWQVLGKMQDPRLVSYVEIMIAFICTAYGVLYCALFIGKRKTGKALPTSIDDWLHPPPVSVNCQPTASQPPANPPNPPNLPCQLSAYGNRAAMTASRPTPIIHPCAGQSMSSSTTQKHDQGEAAKLRLRCFDVGQMAMGTTRHGGPRGRESQPVPTSLGSLVRRSLMVAISIR